MKMIFYPGCEFFNNQNDNDDKYVYSNLTIGNEYECAEINTIRGSYYLITNDRNQVCRYYKNYFLTIEEYRNKKLGEIGI